MMLKIFVLVAMLTVVHAAATKPKVMDAAEIYDSVPNEEKKPFLMFNLANALEGNSATRPALILHRINVTEDLVEKFKSMDIPKAISNTYYDWIARDTNYNRDEMTLLALMGRKCGPPCMDLNNPHSTCC